MERRGGRPPPSALTAPRDALPSLAPVVKVCSHPQPAPEARCGAWSCRLLRRLPSVNARFDRGGGRGRGAGGHLWVGSSVMTRHQRCHAGGHATRRAGTASTKSLTIAASTCAARAPTPPLESIDLPACGWTDFLGKAAKKKKKGAARVPGSSTCSAAAHGLRSARTREEAGVSRRASPSSSTSRPFASQLLGRWVVTMRSIECEIWLPLYANPNIRTDRSITTT